jgi:hypothetical protein
LVVNHFYAPHDQAKMEMPSQNEIDYKEIYKMFSRGINVRGMYFGNDPVRENG